MTTVKKRALALCVALLALWGILGGTAQSAWQGFGA